MEKEEGASVLAPWEEALVSLALEEASVEEPEVSSNQVQLHALLCTCIHIVYIHIYRTQIAISEFQ